MKFSRYFTKPNLPIEDQIEWKTTSSLITKANGEIVFEMKEIEVPSHWSQQATNILAQKYFRKAGVPKKTFSHLSLDHREDQHLPPWLLPQKPDEKIESGSEISAKQVFHRLAGAWTYWGWKEGIFNERDQAGAVRENEDFARIFYDEIYWMLAHQLCAPNSPQWFNTGLNWAYGIKGDANGQWICDENGPRETSDSYTNPQPHACFIQPISDNLVEGGGIFDLLKKEARLFKHGSGTGTNFSNIRGKGEKLAGGGVSSGLMSFLKIFDTGAGAISSGGTTRRAAKMVCLDLDHPEIESFINWKWKEERKARALVIGSEILSEDDDGEIYDNGFEGKAINTVSAQNANDSIRITNKFLHDVDEDKDWNLTARKGGGITKTIQAKYLWEKIIHAAWACGDPGLQFHDTINLWHTCKNDGEINASNPCSEYMFLDDTACNLASLNLGKFLHSGIFNCDDFIYATRLWTIVLEISVFMASFPSKEIAQNSYNYRTLGLGYANLGGILMRLGLGYDSDKGRNYASCITALMHGVSYLTSAELAEELGPFTRWEDNKESMAKVIEMHAIPRNWFALGPEFENTLIETWDKVVKARHKGYRNAQVTLLAPTGTISLLMDCDTSGIEPDFSLIKYKNLSGGGMMQIVNECVPEALKTLGYTPNEIILLLQYIAESGNLEGVSLVNDRQIPEEHLSVFDCANTSGDGTRSLRPLSHVLMMAAVQPFLSGAISKTCNLPNNAAISDVDSIYREAHRLGLKAIAIYRDGSKLTQPLSSKKETQKEIQPKSPHLSSKEFWIEKAKEDIDKIFSTHTPHIINGRSAPDLPPSSRKHLPMRRTGYRQKVKIDGQSIYLSTGEYPDGKLGEIWIEIAQEGSTLRSLLGGFSKAISISLQYGVPLQEFIDAFTYTKFEPAGIVEGHDKIKMVTSVLDFVFKELAIHYLGQNEFANIEPPEPSIYLDLDSLKSPLPLNENTLKENLVAYSPPPPKPITKSRPTGNSCPICGHLTLIQTGSCTTCTTCGNNSGCG